MKRYGVNTFCLYQGTREKYGRYILDINDTTGVLNTGEYMSNFTQRITLNVENISRCVFIG